MKSEKLFKKIGVILNELQDQYDYLMENQGHCNELEYSLFQANADFLADHAKILYQFKQEELGKQMGPVDEVSMADEVVVNHEKKSEPERIQEDLTVPAFEFNLSKSITEESLNEHFEFENKTVDELFDRPLSQEEEQVLANKFFTDEQPVPQPIPVVSDEELGPEPFLIHKEEAVISSPVAPVPLPVPEIVQKASEQPVFTQSASVHAQPAFVQDTRTKVEEVKTPSLNELFHAKFEQKNDEQIVEKKISDLKQGINLNDKLLYIKDLFNGYNLAYSEAIEVANKLPDFQAAENFFQKNYASQYNWDEKPATASKFYDLLRSRF